MFRLTLILEEIDQVDGEETSLGEVTRVTQSFGPSQGFDPRTPASLDVIRFGMTLLEVKLGQALLHMARRMKN